MAEQNGQTLWTADDLEALEILQEQRGDRLTVWEVGLLETLATKRPGVDWVSERQRAAFDRIWAAKGKS